jgi:predicted Zn-dependent protease
VSETARSRAASRAARLALAGVVLIAAGFLACGTAPAVMEPFEVPSSTEADVPAERAEGAEAGDYLRQVAVRDVFSDTYLLHWPERKMPLAVYLPPPPEWLFPDPERMRAEVRRAVLDWTDVAAPGVPSFRFVESHGQADIPIVWAAEPDGDWYIAHCAYQVNLRQKRFGVERILVTGRWGDDRVAEPSEIYEVVLHEMGHALGLFGHSDDPRDIMYPQISGLPDRGLSGRDRNTLRALYAGPNRQIRGLRGRRW